jgi:hypothetical protein
MNQKEVSFLSCLSQLGMVVHAHNPSYLEGGGRRSVSLKTAQAKLSRPNLKNKIHGRAPALQA